MLKRLSKNEDLVIQVEGSNVTKLEYYTDGACKYEVAYSPTIHIPSSELQKMNDGLLKSSAYIATSNDNFPDGVEDKVIDYNFNIWLGGINKTIINGEYYTKEEINEMFLNIDFPDDYLTLEDLNSEINVVIQNLSEYALKTELSEYATKSELTTAIGNIDLILDNINGEI